MLMLVKKFSENRSIYIWLPKVFSELKDIIRSIPCGCIKCITAFVPPALIVPFKSDLEIYPFVTSHAV